MCVVGGVRSESEVRKPTSKYEARVCVHLTGLEYGLKETDVQTILLDNTLTLFKATKQSVQCFSWS